MKKHTTFFCLLLLFSLFFQACGNSGTPGPTPDLLFSALEMKEGEVKRTINLEIMLSLAAGSETSVLVTTKDGTATAGEDYTALTNFKVSFAAGENRKNIAIEIIGDDIYEEDEYFQVDFSGPVNVALRETSAWITLQNDDVKGFTIPDGPTSPESYDGMDLLWQDEFSGEKLDDKFWTPELGGHGWGNNELEYYRAENTSLREGVLVIEAKEENFGGKKYTSSRLITKDKFSFKYGRVDIRAVLPEGKGIWPALWMLGANFSDVGWPHCGEIDIMEMVGGPDTDNKTHGTIHWQHGGAYANYGGHYELPTGKLSDKFHVYSVTWDEKLIIWYIDGEKFHEVDITPADLSEFHEKFFLIFNVAVGGNWPGSPDASTVFPQRMLVDYVRVFQTK